MGSSMLVFGHCNIKSSDLLFVAEIYKATFVISSPVALERLSEYLKKQDENNSPISAKNAHQQEKPVLQTLQQMKYCLSYGAPLRRPIGDFLRSKGLNIQNQYRSSGKKREHSILIKH